MAAETFRDLAIEYFATPADMERWIAKHYADQQGVWLKIAKKDAPDTSINHDQALDIALCYGWIDGQAYGQDEHWYLQKYTPRRAKSMWSQRNIGKVAKLIEAGKMQPSGQAQIDAANADGRWDAAYAAPSDITMPGDLQAELDKHPKAQAFYNTLNKANTYAILWRVYTAKKPETRQARIQKLVQMLEAGEKIHP